MTAALWTASCDSHTQQNEPLLIDKVDDLEKALSSAEAEAYETKREAERTKEALEELEEEVKILRRENENLENNNVGKTLAPEEESEWEAWERNQEEEKNKREQEAIEKSNQELAIRRLYEETTECNQYAISLLNNVRKNLRQLRMKKNRKDMTSEVDEVEMLCVEEYKQVQNSIKARYRNPKCLKFIRENLTSLTSTTISMKNKFLSSNKSPDVKRYLSQIDNLITKTIKNIQNGNSEVTDMYFSN